jgi:hypothetical protein
MALGKAAGCRPNRPGPEWSWRRAERLSLRLGACRGSEGSESHDQ